MSKPKLTVTKDGTQDLARSIANLAKAEVLVGVPDGDTGRDDSGVSNATLLAICNFGSPANNIPPWPVMDIGIRAAQEQVTEQFKSAGKAALNGNDPSKFLERAGIIASNSIKNVITAQIDVPPDKPEESTLDARKARGFKGTKYWLVTGQLRNSITYVVRTK